MIAEPIAGVLAVVGGTPARNQGWDPLFYVAAGVFAVATGAARSKVRLAGHGATVHSKHEDEDCLGESVHAPSHDCCDPPIRSAGRPSVDAALLARDDLAPLTDVPCPSVSGGTVYRCAAQVFVSCQR